MLFDTGLLSFYLTQMLVFAFVCLFLYLAEFRLTRHFSSVGLPLDCCDDDDGDDDGVDDGDGDGVRLL